MKACSNCGRGHPNNIACMCRGLNLTNAEFNTVIGQPRRTANAESSTSRYWTVETGWTTRKPRNWGILQDHGSCPEKCPQNGPDGPPIFNFPTVEDLGQPEEEPMGKTRAEKYINWLYGQQRHSDHVDQRTGQPETRETTHPPITGKVYATWINLGR